MVLYWACRKGNKMFKGNVINEGQVIHPIRQPRESPSTTATSHTNTTNTSNADDDLNKLSLEPSESGSHPCLTCCPETTKVTR